MSRKGAGAKERRRALDLRPALAKAQLDRIYRRDRGICQLCGEPCTREEASREHKVRLVDGGSTDDGNVVLAHKACNCLADPEQEMRMRNYTSQSAEWEEGS